MKKIISSIVVLALVLVGAFWLFNSKQSNESGDESKFKLAFNVWVGYAPFWLAQEKGFFAEEGIDVQITTIEDVAQKKSAMVKGDIDGLADTVDLLVLARNEQVPSVAVMEIDVSNGADGILATENIKAIKDLKGKKVAVQKNFVSESFLYYMLKKNNMSPSDIEVIDMEASAAGAAFVSGNVDVAVTFEPWMSKSNERKGGHILTSSKDADNALVDILSINKDYLAKHPENVQKVMRGWFKALEYIKTNPQDAYAIMAKHYDVTPAEFQELIGGLDWPNLTEQKQFFGTSKEPGQIYKIADTFIDVFLETKQLLTKPDVAPAINSKLLYELNAQ